MTEIDSKFYHNTNSTTTRRENKKEPFIIEAHTSSNMKLERPKVDANDIQFALPQNQKFYSDKEANMKINAINSDIYVGAKKEKKNHEFNTKRYLTIFGIIALLTAAICYFRKK